MATVTFSGTGLASNTARWSGGALPALGTDKVVFDATAVCTLDGAYHWGDDTSTAVTVNAGGVIKASRSVSSSLRILGTMIQNGEIDFGTEASPIPAGIVATLKWNNSTAPAHGKWTVSMLGASTKLRAWGAQKTARTAVSAVTSTTVFDVPGATGWLVGDWLCLGPISAGSSTVEIRGITAITPLGGTAARVTIGAAPANTTVAGRDVANITRNVKLGSDDPANFMGSAQFSAGASSALELGDCEIIGFGSGSAAASTASTITFTPTVTNTVAAIKRVVVHDIAAVSGATVTLCTTGVAVNTGLHLMTAGNFATPVIEPLLVSKRNVNGIALGGAAAPVIVSPVLFGVGALFPNAALAGSSFGATISDPYARGFARVFANLVIGPAVIRGGSLGGYSRILETSMQTTGAGYSIVDCNLDGGGLGATNAATIVEWQSTAGAGGVTMSGCAFPAGSAVPRTANLGAASALAAALFISKNNDPLAQERYNRSGQMVRDNSVAKRGTSAVRFDCWYSANTQTYTFSVAVAAGATITLRGSMRYATAYGTTYPPSVTVSGLGITPAVATCPTSAADTWHDYALTATNPNAYPGSFTVTYSGRSTANAVGAYCWFDGIADAPWVTVTRHYGYVLDSQAAVTVDASITIAEAAALALPVAVNHAAQTITVTGALTADQVRQACVADECAPSSLIPTLRPAHITASAGVVFATTYTVVLGVGGSIAGAYADATGRKVVVSAPALVSGTRVQLYDVTTATELFNDTIGSGGLTFAATWTTDHNIRLRADHADKLPLQTLGVLTSSGLSFLDVQADDTVYLGNGVDGSTATEFAPDGANIQIDINDPDGVTSIQRLYAWMQWYQTTSAGIASVFFGAMVAVDAVTYIIDQAAVNILLDNVSALPVRIVGGYLARKDGSTIISATSGSIQMDPGKAYLAGGNAPSAETTAAAVRTEIATELGRLDAPVSTRLPTSGYDTDSIASAVWARVLEAGLTAEQMQRAMLATLAGRSSGVGTSTENYLAQDGATPRVTAVFDTTGNRVGVTVNGA